MKLFIFKLIILLVVPTTFSCQQVSESRNRNKNLLETDRAFSRMSVTKGAPEAFHFYLTEDALMLPDKREPVIGKELIYTNMLAGQRTSILEWEPVKAEVSESGDLGYTWGTYTLTIINDEGNKQIKYGKYLNIWKKQDDGSWKLAVDMGNQSPAPKL